jgi:hypothetical protein
MSDNENNPAMELSDAISAGLADTINGVLAAHGGGFISGFVGVVQYIDNEGDNCWSFCSMEAQSLSMSVGMLRIASRIADRQVDDVYGLRNG